MFPIQVAMNWRRSTDWRIIQLTLLVVYMKLHPTVFHYIIYIYILYIYIYIP